MNRDRPKPNRDRVPLATSETGETGPFYRVRDRSHLAPSAEPMQPGPETSGDAEAQGRVCRVPHA